VDVSPSSGGILYVYKVPPFSYPATYTFNEGTVVELEAVPASGYIFQNWSGNLSGSTNPATVVLDCNKNITANFSEETNTQVSWPLIGGLGGGLVLAVAIAAFLIVRRSA